MVIGAAMWQRRFGWWLANLGNWIAGWPWGEDHYLRAIHDCREMDEEDDDREPSR